MEKIKSILTVEISKKGYISISKFMEISLTHPEEGYYINQKPLGEAGDFITAPDITQIFGEVIGAWAVDVINKINSKSSFQIVDLGGGRGTLLNDIKRVNSDNNISFGFLDLPLIFLQFPLNSFDFLSFALTSFDFLWCPLISFEFL